MTKDEFIALNIAEGNIIVDAENGKVFRTRGPGGVRLNEPKEIKGSDCNGYLVTKIVNNGFRFTCKMHRIVWISQHGVIPKGYCIDHINNNKKDNRISNLQMLTHEENSTKAAKDGLYLCGEDSPASKISNEARYEISWVYHHSDYTQRQLAEIYGISKSRVGQIVNSIGWTLIGEPEEVEVKDYNITYDEEGNVASKEFAGTHTEIQYFYEDENGKKKRVTDSARYKALGNSIAVGYANNQSGYWMVLMKRISAQYERSATLGSLFSGIGGFELAHVRYNGSDSVRWSSEIESFPIAVLKAHFGDEEAGTEGDIRDYL